VATVVPSKISPHLAKGKFVVMMVDFFSCRALMTWKNRFNLCLPSGRYPISSHQKSLSIAIKKVIDINHV